MPDIVHPFIHKRTSVVTGMSLMAFAMFSAPGMDAIAKYLGEVGKVAPGITTLGRFIIQAGVLFCLLAFLCLIGRRNKILPRQIWGNLLRGALMGLAAFLFFTAVTFMPIADAIAIFFAEPFIVTILSAILLGERVGWRRRVAVLVGFGGALIVIQPSFQEVGLVALLPLGTALTFSFYLILTRKIASDQDDPLSMQFAAGLGGCLMMVVAILIGGLVFRIDPLLPVLPTTELMWWLIAALGLLGTISHLLIVIACVQAPASVLAPFQYIEIISATVLGFVLFDDFPSPIKWVGICIIVASGIYIFIREARISRAEEARG